MDNSMIHSLIEALIRKALNEIQDNPQRSVRNLVDMALHFTKSGFQRHFFQTARTMLENENSGYYRLIPDAASVIDEEKLIEFGINIGYNSFIEGAKTIRNTEKRHGFNIPWNITFAIDGNDYLQDENRYDRIVQQGMELGIYTWMIYCTDKPAHIVHLAGKHRECAFILFCNPAEITHSLLDEAESVHNIMFAVQHTNHIEDACRLMRKRGVLYSVWYSYTDKDVPLILNGEYLADTDVLHPLFTAFACDKKCSPDAKQQVYQYICDTRNSQKYATVLWDFFSDTMYVDSIISDDCCSAFIDKNGYLYTYINKPVETGMNIFDKPVKDIFKQIFSK